MESKRSSYYNQLSEDMRVRYEEKIKKCDNIDPYTIKDKDLSKDRKDFPEISIWDIGNHLIYSMSPYTKKMFKNFKSTDAYRFFESGFVLKIGAKKFENFVIVKGNVKHSQRMNLKSLEAWFLSTLDGTIISGHCTCIAGLSETCSHVAALCFTVNSIKNTKDSVSATDLLCTWNVPKFSDNPMSKGKDIKWNSKSYDESANSSIHTDSTFRSYCQSLPYFSDDAIDDFINILQDDGLDPGFKNEIRRSTKLKDELFLANMFKEDHLKKSLNALVELGKSMHLKADVEEINRLTLPHLKSKLWIALRRGRITDSNLKDCCATSVERPSITTINRLINPVSAFDNLPTVRYQKQNKKKAINQYTTGAQEFHENFQCHQSGLIIKQDTPYFASSCDGLVSCLCHGRGCIEVKCLKILESEPFDILTCQPNNILHKIDDDFYLAKNHDLFYKTQMQIHLSESSYCDLILWSRTKFLVVRVDADIEFWELAKWKALNFYQQVAIPELLGKYFTKCKEENDDESSQDLLQLIGLEIEILTSEDE